MYEIEHIMCVTTVKNHPSMGGCLKQEGNKYL